MKSKKCSICGVNDKHSTSSYCRECRIQYNNNNKTQIKEYNKQRYEKDKIKILGKIKEYKNKHEEEIKRYLKQWFIDNKKEVYRKNMERYYKDPIFRIKIALRSSLKSKLDYKGVEKTLSSLKLVGCSVEFLKNYLEKQFYPEMNWENHGIVWEIDHIKPCASFDLIKEEEQQKCFHYTNLQPLFKTTEIAESFGYKDQIGNRNKSKY